MTVELIHRGIHYTAGYNYAGKVRHIALVTDNFNELVEKLEEVGREFSRIKSGRATFFCRDPTRNTLEF